MFRGFVFCLLFSFFPFFKTWAVEAFRVTLHHNRAKVQTPKKKRERVSVIIDNKTVSVLRLKLMSEKKNLEFITINPRNSYSTELSFPKTGSVYLIALSPPLNELELNFADGRYEVPKTQ